MAKKVEAKEVKKIRFEIDEGHLFKIGRFTIVRIVDENGVESVGQARLADGDKYNAKIAYNIALGRAKKSAEMKVKKSEIKKPLMG